MSRDAYHLQNTNIGQDDCKYNLRIYILFKISGIT